MSRKSHDAFASFGLHTKSERCEFLMKGRPQSIQLGGQLSPTTARALLRLKFSPQDEHRMQELAAAAGDGTLTSQEENETDTYEQLGCLLDILDAQARQAIRRRNRGS
jgi:hypothetical protein